MVTAVSGLVRYASMRINYKTAVLLLLACLLQGCFAASGLKEIRKNPYPVLEQDESSAKFLDPEGSVFVEIRTAKISRPIENLAIHYPALFPGGEIIRPGDKEQYLKINGKNAYKVEFATNYIRRRKRVPDNEKLTPDKVPPGWNLVTIEDPVSGKPVQALYGPVIPRQKILYLVVGDKFVYYVFLRADGESIETARNKFEEFVRKDIAYR